MHYAYGYTTLQYAAIQICIMHIALHYAHGYTAFYYAYVKLYGFKQACHLRASLLPFMEASCLPGRNMPSNNRRQALLIFLTTLLGNIPENV